MTLKKRIETLSSQKAFTKAPSHANRLIVRNLPFTTTEQDLRSIFLRYGPIYSINMPLNASPSSKETVKTEEDAEQLDSAPRLNKGFAFIWFYSRKDAEKAMEGINGTVVRAGAAEELVKSKQKKKKERRVERKLAAQKERESTGDVEGDKEAEERENDAQKSERVVAVDWALSKDRWEEEKAKMDEEVVSESEESDGGNSSSDSEGADEEGEEESGSDAHDQEASNGETRSDQSEDERDEDDKPMKPQLPQTDVGTTLFIRNIPYDATEDELRTL